jgi:Trk K+ transport system NAD-binding subunit
LVIIIGGSLVFHLAYTLPGTDLYLSFSEALYATFTLMFFSPEIPYPEQWYLQALFFIIPIFGLAAVADGVLRFGSALLSRQSRGQKWQVAMASTYRNHIVVCGVGKVGYRVILELRKFGKDIVAVEEQEDGRFVEKIQELEVPILIADARRRQTLLKASVDKANAIIPCTDDELTNLDIALDARELNPDIRVVLRMFDHDLAKKIEKGFDIHFAFSTSAVSAPIFAAAAMRENVKHSFYVGENLLHLSQVTIENESQLSQMTVGELEEDLNLSVVCHDRNGSTDLHPENELKLEAGDEILVLTTLENLRRLNNMNAST